MRFRLTHPHSCKPGANVTDHIFMYLQFIPEAARNLLHMQLQGISLPISAPFFAIQS